MDAERLRGLIREIPDFPQRGIGFKDITPLLADPGALAESVGALADYGRQLRVDCVVAAEARGFLLGPALALELGVTRATVSRAGRPSSVSGGGCRHASREQHGGERSGCSEEVS